jgi:histidinol-phosphatase
MEVKCLWQEYRMTGKNHAPPGREELKHFLEKGLEIIHEAEHVLLKAKEQGFSYRLKSDKSVVTDADLEVEKTIRESIGRTFPGHAILGEELPDKVLDSDFQWIIDPIDGTRSFRHGIPLYGTILALKFRGKSVLGIINLPELNICVCGAEGLGTSSCGKKLHLTGQIERMPVEEEIIAIGERRPFIRSNEINVFDTLMKSHPCVRTYCDCFGHVLTLLGSVGAMVDFDLKSWDMAATEILIQEAGGKFVILDSRPVDNTGSSYDVVFGKSHVVDWILGTITGKSGMVRTIP